MIYIESMANPRKSYEFDQSFYKLADSVTKAIQRNKKDGTDQKQQLENLLEAELRFHSEVLKYKRQSREIYKKFLQKITVSNKNILSARPYFRESAINFSKSITPAIKANDIEKLKTFTINFNFIQFIRNNWLGPFPKRAEALYLKVETCRRKLIENNIPLAINRAKLFFRKTPRGHLDLMDLIIISCYGLATGVDKWSMPTYSQSFKPMLIGRITGPTIEQYSQTVLHFFPNDKKIIYRANSIRGRQGIKDIVELTEAVNKSFEQDKREGKGIPPVVTVAQLSELLQSSSTVSADSVVNDEGVPVYGYTPDSKPSAETQYIEQEEKNSVYLLVAKLPLLHRKVLKLKGLKF